MCWLQCVFSSYLDLKKKKIRGAWNTQNWADSAAYDVIWTVG